MAMLELNGVCFGYPGRGVVLKGVDLSVPEGVTVVVGPNGGGKTTLLRLLAGLVEKKSGEITFAGESAGPGKLRKAARMVMQDSDPQILGTTVCEDIELGRAASELGEKFTEAAQKIGARLGLAELWNEPVDVLSYGQKRKLCLAHALLAGPRVLLLDEPFAGLDFPASVELRDFIRRNSGDGLVQVISTHELDPVFDLADRVVVVAEGKVVLSGTPGEVGPELGSWSVRAPGKGW